MLRFIMSCLAAFGTLVMSAAAGISPIGALLACVVVFFITNGLGD